jgi:hypothetical protein
MSEFAVRDLNEKTVATFRDFEEAWNHLVINLENEGDIVEEVVLAADNISNS